MLGLLLLAGCATQTYQAQPLAPETQAFAARTAGDAGLAGLAQWDLTALTQAAVRLHPDMQIAKARLSAAQAAEISAGQRPNPSISAGGEHHSNATDVSPWTVSLGLGLPIETNGKREARIEQAAALSDAARLGVAQTAWEVRSRLRLRLMDVYEIRKSITLQQREVSTRSEIVAMLEKRFEAGLASSVDVADARLLLRKAEAALQVLNGRLDGAYTALASAIGLPEQALDRSRLSLAGFERDAVELPAAEVQRAALLNRLDVRQSLATYAAAEAKLKLEIAKQYPDITLGPSYGWDQGDNRWGLNISTILALFNKNEGAIAEAKAQREVEARKFDLLQATVIGQQELALARYTAAVGDVAQSKKLLIAQQARYEKTQRQFAAGQADRLELTLTRLELLTVESTLGNAQIRVQQALGALEDAVQQPLDGSAAIPQVLENNGLEK